MLMFVKVRQGVFEDNDKAGTGVLASEEVVKKGEADGVYSV